MLEDYRTVTNIELKKSKASPVREVIELLEHNLGRGVEEYYQKSKKAYLENIYGSFEAAVSNNRGYYRNVGLATNTTDSVTLTTTNVQDDTTTTGTVIIRRTTT